jgi:hypothetical protein
MAYPSPFTIIKSSELQVNELYVLFNPWTDSIICVKITNKNEDGIITYNNITDETHKDITVDWDKNGFGVFHLSKSQQKGGTKRRRNNKSRKSRRVLFR